VDTASLGGRRNGENNAEGDGEGNNEGDGEGNNEGDGEGDADDGGTYYGNQSSPESGENAGEEGDGEGDENSSDVEVEDINESDLNISKRPGEEKKQKKYLRLIAQSLRKLNSPAFNDYLKMNKKLIICSRKYYEIMTRIKRSEGPALVYSQFKMVEGLGVFNLVLENNGFGRIELKLLRGGGGYDLTEESFENLKNKSLKRYIVFSGDGVPAERSIFLKIFNGQLSQLPVAIKEKMKKAGFDESKKYIRGEICSVIGITSAGAEGISLRNVRQVHIMEPYWNNGKLEQVKGRAIRG
jgi:hypothetical protein